MRTTRRRYWFELGLAVLAGALAVLTLINHEWIEVAFGVDPDQGSGALEWGIVFATASSPSSAGSRREPNGAASHHHRPDADGSVRLASSLMGGHRAATLLSVIDP